MTMVPMYKTCSRCKRKYFWNPDVGKMWCPYCGPLSMSGAGNILWEKLKTITIFEGSNIITKIHLFRS